MKRAIFLLLTMILIVGNLFAGERVKHYTMKDSTGNSPQEPIWVEVDSAGSRSVWFIFDNYKGPIQTSGFTTVVVYFDTSSGGVAITNLDTVDVTLTKLFYNRATYSDALPATGCPISNFSEPAKPASGDTLHLKTDLKWRVGHADGEYAFSTVLNLRAGIAGLKLTFGTNLKTNGYQARGEIWQSEDR